MSHEFSVFTGSFALGPDQAVFEVPVYQLDTGDALYAIADLGVVAAALAGTTRFVYQTNMGPWSNFDLGGTWSHHHERLANFFNLPIASAVSA